MHTIIAIWDILRVSHYLQNQRLVGGTSGYTASKIPTQYKGKKGKALVRLCLHQLHSEFNIRNW